MRFLVLFLLMTASLLAQVPTLDLQTQDGVQFLTQDGVVLSKADENNTGKFVLKLQRIVSRAIARNLSTSGIVSPSETTVLVTFGENGTEPLVEASGDEQTGKFAMETIRKELASLEKIPEKIKRSYPNGFRVPFKINITDPNATTTPAN